MCIWPGGVSGQTAARVGLFDGHEDVGTVLHKGNVEYDAASKTYTVTGSGENMWAANDDFHFVWKKVSGDFSLTADIVFPQAGGNAHRKAVLIARQSLAADSAYVDVAVHGDGLTSLQAREQSGAPTREVGINAAHPRRARLQKRGDTFFMWLAGEKEELRFSGGSMRVPLKAPFYVGIGVCAHDKDAVEKAVFSNVTLSERVKGGIEKYSTLETVSVSSTDRRVAHVDRERMESPGWSADGAWLRFVSKGLAYRVSVKERGAAERVEREDVAGAAAVELPQDEFVNCFGQASPDGRQVAFLSYDKGTKGCPADKEVLLRVVSMADKKTRVIGRLIGGPGTLGTASWSPDGRMLVFVSHHSVPRQSR